MVWDDLQWNIDFRLVNKYGYKKKFFINDCVSGMYGTNEQQWAENLKQRHRLLHEARQAESLAISFEIMRNGNIA